MHEPDGWFRRELDDVENRLAERALSDLMAAPARDMNTPGRNAASE